MKNVLLTLVILLAASACGKYDVYEDSLQFMTVDTLSAEKSVVDARLQEAQADLAKAEASGNPEEIKKAHEAYADAKARAADVAAEQRHRARGW